ncbi:hypothetical protein FACS1894124_7970 [Spirochaetia bacterium]|nr:hypothetical protein FACS1894124_7970 [Spirochaetia bacterium]
MNNVSKSIALTGIVAALLLATCGSSPAAESNSAAQVQEPAAAQKKPAAWFEGDGGKNLRIAVLQPEGKGLSADEQYLLTLIQGSITGDFNKYSGLTVMDRLNLDAILQEQNLSLNGNFSEDNYISIGNLTNTQYILTGSVTKARNVFILELSVTDVESGERRASYPPRTCTGDELLALGAVKDASEDLLTQLGVKLTGEGRQALHRVTASAVHAEAALARGITAQNSGTVVEALSYYYDASSYDSALTEANSRLSVLSKEVSGNTIGQNARNDIQLRNAWRNILEECQTFYQNHLPVEIIYDPALTQTRINYEKETVDLQFSIMAKPADSFKKVVKDIMDGLAGTGKQDEWGFRGWPLNLRSWTGAGQTVLSSSIIDTDEPFDGNSSGYRNYRGTLGVADWQSVKSYGKKIPVEAALLDEHGEIIGRTRPTLVCVMGYLETTARQLGAPASRQDFVFMPDKLPVTVSFNGVKADAITDKLTIKVTTVNGVRIDSAGADFVKIAAGKVR